jgi:cullin 1
MPPANASLETTWAYLEQGINCIMNNTDSLSVSEYMNLYSTVLNYYASSRMRGNLDSSVGRGGRSESFGTLAGHIRSGMADLVVP